MRIRPAPAHCNLLGVRSAERNLGPCGGHTRIRRRAHGGAGVHLQLADVRNGPDLHSIYPTQDTRAGVNGPYSAGAGGSCPGTPCPGTAPPATAGGTGAVPDPSDYGEGCRSAAGRGGRTASRTGTSRRPTDPLPAPHPPARLTCPGARFSAVWTGRGGNMPVGPLRRSRPVPFVQVRSGGNGHPFPGAMFRDARCFGPPMMLPCSPGGDARRRRLRTSAPQSGGPGSP